jgi:hypothetical protein
MMVVGRREAAGLEVTITEKNMEKLIQTSQQRVL